MFLTLNIYGIAVDNSENVCIVSFCIRMKMTSNTAAILCIFAYQLIFHIQQPPRYPSVCMPWLMLALWNTLRESTFRTRPGALENSKTVKSRAKALDLTVLESLDSGRVRNITFPFRRGFSSYDPVASTAENNDFYKKQGSDLYDSIYMENDSTLIKSSRVSLWYGARDYRLFQGLKTNPSPNHIEL